MDELLGCFFCAPVPLFVVGIVALVIILAQVQVKKANEAWSRAADILGLHYQAGGWTQTRTLMGQFKGLWVHVDTYTTRSGKHSHTYTRYRVSFPEPLRLGLRLTRQGFFSRIWTSLGGQDIPVGDDVFDEDVVVKGADAQAVAQYLTPARRMRFHRLLMHYSNCTVDDQGIQLLDSGVETDAEKMVDIIRRFVHVARHVSGLAGDEARVSHALEAMHVGELDTALEVVRAVPVAEEDPDADVHMLEGEILYSGGRYEEATEAFNRARREAPKDTEAANWADRAARHSRNPSFPHAATPPLYVAREVTPEPVEPLAPSEPGPASSTPAQEATDSASQPPAQSVPSQSKEQPSSLTVQEVSEALFHKDAMTYQADERFEEKYKGKTIQWSGVLGRVNSFTYDMVFGSEPGTKALLEIHQLTTGGYGGNKVQAVVRFPPQLRESLEGKLQQTLTFRGRLVGCDAFMRNLFVDEGQLLDG